MNVALTLKSRNKKVGPIPVSTTESGTCPPACAFRKNGCYADAGPLALFWKKVTDGVAGMPWNEFINQVKVLKDGQLWRHNQAGDLPGKNNKLDSEKCLELASANKGKKGFTYSHYPLSPDNMETIHKMNQDGFTVNASANSPAHADLLKKRIGEKNIPLVTVLSQELEGEKVTHTPAGEKILICPATWKKEFSCAQCGICQHAGKNRAIVGFPAHGTSKKKASAIALAG